ncbi:MAG: hypothetical protein E3J72_11510 [Planctomycetota bacterium]|nr:MAG: hypothetical protein E3J72_11510 [Planctomycetota bacterium]
MNRIHMSALLLLFALVLSSLEGCKEAPKVMAPVGTKPRPKTRKANIPPEKKAPEPPDETFSSTPTPRDEVRYILGPNDKILIRIKDVPGLEQELVVSVDGKIMPKLLDPMQAEGKTIEQIMTDLEEAYEKGGLVRDASVSVGLKEGRQHYVFVAGSLPKAGKLTISGQPSLLEVLTLAGWTEDSPIRSITAVREGKYKTINLDELISGKKLSDNIILKSGDLIIAAKDFPITVTGAVNKPGKYNLDGATRRSVAWVIAKADGLGKGAVLDAVKIIGKDGTERLVDLNPILFGDANERIDFISPGETMYIPISKKIKIFILGMVNRPGQFSVDEGITVTQAIALADFERFGAVMSAATLITGYFDKREDGKTHPESITFDLAAVLEGKIDQNYQMDDGSVLYIPESTTSDVLDFLNRLLSPLSGMVGVAASAQDISESGEPK